MRKKIVAGNWKMNKTFDKGLELASEVINMINDEAGSGVISVLCVPFIHLSAVKKMLAGQTNVFLGAQNCYTKTSGAYTGEISAEMLKSVGADYVIIGHSERREYFNESNKELAEKVDLVLANGMTPIFCCGESLQTREHEDYISFVKNQITESLFHLSESDILKIVIAYEPIWAIGTGLTASAEQAQEMHEALRAHIAAQYGAAVASEISILYGGSAKPSNAAELFAKPDVDGGLIGGASLSSRDFTDIVKARA